MIRKVFVTATILSPDWSVSALGADSDEELSADDFLLGSEAYFASQPTPNLSTDEARAAQSRTSRSSGRSSYNRLSRAPHMFGDSIGSIGQLIVTVQNTPFPTFVTDLPLGGGRGLKVAENNLALFLKHWCYSSDSLSIAGGLGLGPPTGSDLNGRIGVTPFSLRNEAVHLVPYLGFLMLPTVACFVQGFVDVDLAANGNSVELGPPGAKIGTLTEPNLLHVDLSAGHWVFRNDDATYLTGVAVVGELHYTSALQNADEFMFTTTGQFPAVGQFQNLANRTDILNLTAGLHFRIGELSNLRVAAVVPVRNAPDRQFDSEIQVSFNRFF